MAQRVIEPPARDERLRMSYEEYHAWSGDRFSEWVDGEVTIFMSVKRFHQRLAGFLYRFMSELADAGDLGEVLIAPSEMLVRDGRSSREPDVMFVAREHQDRNTPDRVVGPADLVVEIVSEDSVTRDTRDKYREYEEIGVPEYWIFDARDGHRSVVAYALVESRFAPIAAADDGAIHSRVLPGFFFHLDWVHKDPLPAPPRVAEAETSRLREAGATSPNPAPTPPAMRPAVAK